MTAEHFINAYGYLAILFGTFFEGETILLLGGIAAKLGYLELPWVIVCGFAGSLFGDQLFFFIGRYRGQAFLEKRPAWQGRAAQVHRVMDRHRIAIILGFRFMYGLRTVTPFVLGMSRIPVAQFLLLNLISAALWAGVIGVLGYAFGHALELLLGDIRRYEMAIFAVGLIVGASIWALHRRHIRR